MLITLIVLDVDAYACKDGSFLEKNEKETSDEKDDKLDVHHNVDEQV